MTFLNISIVYLFLSVIIITFLMATTYSKGRSIYFRNISLLCFFADIYIFGYLMELKSITLGDMIFWNQIQYLGVPFFPAFWLTTALNYTGHKTDSKKMFLILLIPFMTFFIRITNDFHHFYYTTMTIKKVESFFLMNLGKGFWYYIQSAYNIFTMIFTTVVLSLSYKKRPKSEMKLLNTIFLGTSIPYVGLLFIIFYKNNPGFDYTALTLPIPMIIVSIAFSKYNFMEIKTFARENIFENNFEGVVLLNSDNAVVDFNIKGKEYTDILNIKDKNIINPNTFEIDSQWLKEMKTNEIYHKKITYKTKPRFFEILLKNLDSKSSGGNGKILTLKDITESEILKSQLERLANIDELSGLFNRRYFMEKSHNAFEKNKFFCVAMIDIDFFKNINDSFGHASGDYAIKRFGELFINSFPENCILGRLGGEEFAVLFEGEEIKKSLEECEKFRKIIENEIFSFENKKFNFTISIGLTCNKEFNLSFEELLNLSDKALYSAKDSGRNKTVVF
ncbi:MAG: diguanylate cyclase [Thermotogae bacterium]|nr:diguanylate cyclase [Thermotogota bacterium]